MSFISFGFLSQSELKKKKFGKLPRRCRFFIFLFVNFAYLYFPSVVSCIKALSFFYSSICTFKPCVYLFSSINFCWCLISLFLFWYLKIFDYFMFSVERFKSCKAIHFPLGINLTVSSVFSYVMLDLCIGF